MSNQSERYVPSRSLGITTLIVPTRGPSSRPVPVTPFDPLLVAGAELRPAHAVGLRGQQRVNERAQQLPHQIRAGLRQLVTQEAGRVDTGPAVVVVLGGVGASERGQARRVHP